MRADAKKRLVDCDPALGGILGRRVHESGLILAGAVVAGFLPLGNEIDIRPLLQDLRAAGHVVALPRTPARGQPLSFRRWGERDELEQEAFGTMTSTGSLVVPDVLLVPMLAFDRSGARLGYGGGYYDRTLAAQPGVQTIGCAYAAQEWQAVPSGPTDMRLQAIATEREIIVV